jgi:hypothetical protein
MSQLILKFNLKCNNDNAFFFKLKSSIKYKKIIIKIRYNTVII